MECTGCLRSIRLFHNRRASTLPDSWQPDSGDWHDDDANDHQDEKRPGQELRYSEPAGFEAIDQRADDQQQESRDEKPEDHLSWWLTIDRVEETFTPEDGQGGAHPQPGK